MSGSQGMLNQIQGAAKNKPLVLVMTVAGLIGGIAGFFLSEVIQGEPSRFFDDSLVLSTGVWFLLVVVGIGLLLSATQGVLERNPEKTSTNVLTALPALLVGGFISGAIAQAIYTSLLENDGSPVVARTIAWGVAGGLGGLAVGIGFRSLTRVRNCGLGGLGGGLLGGLLFDFIANNSGDDVQARFIGIVLIGTLMGLFIGLLDTASMNLYFELQSGELRGQQFILFDNVSVLGCARTVAVTLVKDPLVAEQHVRATKSNGGLNLECMSVASPVLINGQLVSAGFLPLGGVLQIGNTSLMLRNKKGGPLGSSVGRVHPVVSGNQNAPSAPTAVQPADPGRSRPTIQMPKKPN
jgi:hypothetical protein